MTDVIDTFDRANSTTSLGTASDGGSWSLVGGGTFGINSNRAYMPVAGGSGFGGNAWRLAYRDLASSTVDITVTITRTPSASGRQSIWFCYDPANNSGYRLDYASTTTSWTWTRRATTGTETTLATFTATAAVSNTPTTIHITFDGSTKTFKVSQDGTALLTGGIDHAVDGSTILAGTNVGFAANTAFATAGDTWDNWTAGSVIGPHGAAALAATAGLTADAAVTVLGAVAMSATAGMIVSTGGTQTGAVAMSATAGLTAGATIARNGTVVMAASSGMTIDAHAGSERSVSSTRTRVATVSAQIANTVVTASGAGWEAFARTREASVFAEIDVPVVDPPSKHHTIEHVWLAVNPPLNFQPVPLKIPKSDAWDYTIGREVWGRYRIRVGGQDVTFFRGAQTLISELSDTDPGGDDTCTLVFPRIGPWEILGSDDLSWLPARHHDLHVPVVIERVTAGGTRERRFEGDAYAEEDASDTSGANPLVLHCNGVVKTLDDRITKPRFTSDPIDIGLFIRRLVKYEVKYGWPGHPPAQTDTQVPTGERGAYGEPLFSSTIQNLIAEAERGDDTTYTKYTVDNVRPRGMAVVVRDQTSVDFSFWNGQMGVTHNLINDDSRRFDAVYGEGQSNGVDYWRNTQYPNARAAGDIPAYPASLSVNFSVGDSASGLGQIFDELQSRGYAVVSNDTYLAADLNDIKRFQEDAGILVDGIIGPQTWTRAFQAGLNANVLYAYIRPISVRTGAEPFVYNSRGGIIGPNPGYDHRMRREKLEQFGTVERDKARLSARIETVHKQGTDYIGTITATNIDPPEMCALDTRSGMNLLYRYHRNTDRLLHVTRVDRDPGMAAGAARTVTWTVSEQFDDYITVAERLERRRGILDASGRTKPPRRGAARTPDFAPWDSDSGAGILLRVAQNGGLWNVVPIPGGERGSIVHVRLVADRPTLISAAVFNWHVNPRQLTALPGLANPHTGIGGSNPPDPWQANSKVLTDRPLYADQPWLAWASGALDAMQGYYPHDPAATGSTITGVLDDAMTWPFHSRRAPWLWLAIWTSVDCYISGDPDYKHRALWPAPDTVA